MTEAELDQPVKNFLNITIAFKTYMSISACIEGKGQGYLQQLQVDPIDEFERTMKKKTHFWRNMMMRGQTKAMVVVYHKDNEEPNGVHPLQYSLTFKELNIFEKDQIKIVEMKKNFQEDMSEEAEEELEEYEEEGEVEQEDGEVDGQE